MKSLPLHMAKNGDESECLGLNRSSKGLAREVGESEKSSISLIPGRSRYFIGTGYIFSWSKSEWVSRIGGDESGERPVTRRFTAMTWRM